MKGLLLKKLYYLNRPRFYLVSGFLVLFELSLLIMSQALKAELSDFWTLGLLLCLIMIAVSDSMCISDQSEHWDKYCMVMPVTKKKYVAAEFAANMLVTLGCTIIVSVFPAADMLLNDRFDAKMLFFGSVTIFCICIFLIIFNTVTVLSFGVKGFIILFFVIMAPAIAASAVDNNFMEKAIEKLKVFVSEHDKLILALGEFAVIAAVTVILYFIAVLLYRKKQI